TAIDEWLAESVQSIEIESVDIRLATVFVRRFELGLRMPDAIHLAACRRHNLSLATFDNRLAGAARFIGIATVTPN
ncbi:MAG: PIN domain-containing protein, partial [Janthinobacterium lividum]